MATNLHKHLPDSQVHNPKGFIGASGSSICGKNKSNELEWFNSNYSLTVTITCLDDVSGITGGRNFNLFTKTTNYQVWFDVDNTDSFVVDSGYTGVEVDISAGDNATTIATAVKVALAALSGISASSAGPVVTVTIASSIADKKKVTDGVVGKNTGWKFVTSRNDVGNEYLTTDSSGNIEWIPKPAAVTTSPYLYHHFGGFCQPKSSTNRYLGHSGGGDTAETFNIDLGSAITSGTTTVQPEQIPSLCSFLATSNMVGRRIHYTVAHNHSTAHANIEMHLFRVRPTAGTSGKTIHWFAGINSVGSSVLVVDDEVKYGHFVLTSVLSLIHI